MAIAKIMCFGNGTKEDPDTKKSKEIEKQLREDQRRMQKEVKLLLLGKDTYETGYIDGGAMAMADTLQVPESRANRQY